MHIHVDLAHYNIFFKKLATAFRDEYVKRKRKKIPDYTTERYWMLMEKKDNLTDPDVFVAKELFKSKDAGSPSYFWRRWRDGPNKKGQIPLRAEALIRALLYIDFKLPDGFIVEGNEKNAAEDLWNQFVNIILSATTARQKPTESTTEIFEYNIQPVTFFQNLKIELEYLANNGKAEEFRKFKEKIILYLNYAHELFNANGYIDVSTLINKEIEAFYDYEFKSWEKQLLIDYIATETISSSERTKAIKIFIIKRVLTDEEIIALFSNEIISKHIIENLALLLSEENNTPLLAISCTSAMLTSNNKKIILLGLLSFLNFNTVLSQYKRLLDNFYLDEELGKDVIGGMFIVSFEGFLFCNIERTYSHLFLHDLNEFFLKITALYELDLKEDSLFKDSEHDEVLKLIDSIKTLLEIQKEKSDGSIEALGLIERYQETRLKKFLSFNDVENGISRFSQAIQVLDNLLS